MMPVRSVPAHALPALALGLLLLAGCGGPAAAAGGAGGTDLSAVPACSLVDDADAVAAGLRAPGRAAAGAGAQSCAWSPADGPGVPVVLSVLPGASLDTIGEFGAATGPLSDTAIAGRPARAGGTGPCAVFVEVAGGALGVAGGTGCATAERVAELAIGTLTG